VRAQYDGASSPGVQNLDTGKVKKDIQSFGQGLFVLVFLQKRFAMIAPRMNFQPK
jgi:hypothetical protein